MRSGRSTVELTALRLELSLEAHSRVGPLRAWAGIWGGGEWAHLDGRTDDPLYEVKSGDFAVASIGLHLGLRVALTSSLAAWLRFSAGFSGGGVLATVEERELHLLFGPLLGLRMGLGWYL